MNVIPTNIYIFFPSTYFLDLPSLLKILLFRFFFKKKQLPQLRTERHSSKWAMKKNLVVYVKLGIILLNLS